MDGAAVMGFETLNASVLASSTTGAALASSAGDAADSSIVDSPELLRSCDNPESANAIDSLWSSGQPHCLTYLFGTDRRLATGRF